MQQAESIASSRIEGLVIGGRRLLRAAAARQIGKERPRDRTTDEVLANIDAMAAGIASVGVGEAITPPILLEMHHLLLAATPFERYAGRLRDQQNWLGGSAHSPCGAEFVPPPPDLVAALLDDLCAFASADHCSPLAQAAIVHAQFETIHPFVDGNGRIGRALIHLVLRCRGLGLRASPPISLVLANRTSEYVAALNATHRDGPPDAADGAVGHWVALAAAACYAQSETRSDSRGVCGRSSRSGAGA